MAGRPARALTVGVLIAALAPSAALADADPASDVLLVQNVFYPFSPTVSIPLQRALNAETTAAKQAGFPIKVALIDSPVDLGAVTSLFGNAQRYADFLDQEISFQGKQPLLVVMPSGYGVQGFTGAGPGLVATLSRPAGTQSDDLAHAALTAVLKLAAAAGHQLKGVAALENGSASTSGGSSSPTLIIAIVAVTAVGAAATVIVVRRRHARA
jgi:hypothetical protein